MSAGGRFGGSRGLQAKAPEKGVFPLDHFGECAQVKDEYLKCIADNKGRADRCNDITRAYLVCRMDNTCRDLYCRTVVSKKNVQVRTSNQVGSNNAHVLCRNLMAQQDLKDLGIEETPAPAENDSTTKTSSQPSSREKTKKGFIAGLQ